MEAVVDGEHACISGVPGVYVTPLVCVAKWPQTQKMEQSKNTQRLTGLKSGSLTGCSKTNGPTYAQKLENLIDTYTKGGQYH